MSKYKILWKKSAVKEISKLSVEFSTRIYKAISELANNPRPINCKKLKSLSKYYRIRIGEYRVVYQIEDTILIIEIVRIAHRKDVYQ